MIRTTIIEVNTVLIIGRTVIIYFQILDNLMAIGTKDYATVLTTSHPYISAPADIPGDG